MEREEKKFGVYTGPDGKRVVREVYKAPSPSVGTYTWPDGTVVKVEKDGKEKTKTTIVKK